MAQLNSGRQAISLVKVCCCCYEAVHASELESFTLELSIFVLSFSDGLSSQTTKFTLLVILK